MQSIENAWKTKIRLWTRDKQKLEKQKPYKKKYKKTLNIYQKVRCVMLAHYWHVERYKKRGITYDNFFEQKTLKMKKIYN